MLNRMRKLCGGIQSPHQVPAYLRRAFQQSLAVPAKMFARDPDSGLLAVKKVEGVEMREDDITHLGAKVAAVQFLAADGR